MVRQVKLDARISQVYNYAQSFESQALTLPLSVYVLMSMCVGVGWRDEEWSNSSQ